MEQQCYICHSEQNLHKHEIYHGSANRKISIKYKFQVYLCIYCHTGSNEAVHNNRTADLKLKCEFQAAYELTNSRDSFVKLIGKSYL